MASGGNAAQASHGGSDAEGPVAWQVSPECPLLGRDAIAEFIEDEDFGYNLCGWGYRAYIFDAVAEIAREHAAEKQADVTSTTFSVRSAGTWLETPVDLRPMAQRDGLTLAADVYDYRRAPVGALVVDFANEHVGGDCWGGGFVQEEQMVAQSTDLATRLYVHRQRLSKDQAICYEGVYMDAWWPRDEAAEKQNLDLEAIEPCLSGPFNILAVDAPRMVWGRRYDEDVLQMLAKKVYLIFHVAGHAQSPRILSGLLGGGAFGNNRPLVLLLHLLLLPRHGPDLVFHNPVFWAFGDADTGTMEQGIVEHAESMLDELRAKGVSTLGAALTEILTWQLPLSRDDADLANAPGEDIRLGKSRPLDTRPAQSPTGVRWKFPKRTHRLSRPPSEFGERKKATAQAQSLKDQSDSDEDWQGMPIDFWDMMTPGCSRSFAKRENKKKQKEWEVPADFFDDAPSPGAASRPQGTSACTDGSDGSGGLDGSAPPSAAASAGGTETTEVVSSEELDGPDEEYFAWSSEPEAADAKETHEKQPARGQGGRGSTRRF